MTSPSVVILTEPANCALADGPLLLHAVLEAQELSREGVPVSQAFCDNPAAAETFIEAYASAFAGLQLQSPNLPLPEQLYAMMFGGRLAALPDLKPPPDGAVLDAAGKVQPLVVLSMGAPDALMQALQGNDFAKRNIKLIEIAPLEQAGSASVPVAAAVAAHAIAGASWSPDPSVSSQLREDEGGALALSDGSTDAPLKLDSPEFNLNYLETGDERYPSQHSQSAATMGNTAADVSAASDTTRTVYADVPAADNAASPASQPNPGLEPDTRATAATAQTAAHPAALEPTAAAPEMAVAPEPVVAPDPTPNPVQTADTEGDTPSNPPIGADAPIQPPSSAGDAQTPSPIGSGASDSRPDTEQVPEGPGETAAPSDPGAADAETTEPEEDLADNGSSFSDPEEDVVYPPTGSFTSEDDLPYPLPLAAAPEPDGLGGILQMSLADEIVDFEALSSSADHPTLMPEPFDPILIRAGGSDGREQLGVDGPPPHADTGHREAPTPHHDTHHDEAVRPLHDLDL